jgi:hypothetical protein
LFSVSVPIVIGSFQDFTAAAPRRRMQALVERIIERLALGPAVPREELPGWLEAQGLPREEVAAIVESGLERLELYRELVRGNLWSTLQEAIPRVMARLGPVFVESFDRFLDQRGPRSRYLRDVPRELLDFCEPLWASDPRVPPWMMELARHESSQIEVGSAIASAPASEPEELELDRPLRLSDALRLMRYGWAVHRLSESPEDRSEPEPGPVALLVYRSPEHEVRYLELTPLAAGIVERLLAQATLREAIEEACAASGQALEAAVLDGTARLLADLAERGVLLGSIMTGSVSERTWQTRTR